MCNAFAFPADEMLWVAPSFTLSIPYIRWNSGEVFIPCLPNAALNVRTHGRAGRRETTHGRGSPFMGERSTCLALLPQEPELYP
ncbi:MAG: hypothetical protein HN758_09985 [Verrucomicrobia bacterium]|nr:hypothetical protein [Verrucomicrobiota bacterium]MBT5062006.1 hypothetical protein [Verrucomicrobiota bacterium]MBT5480571.1 hypothetical protein [Verrucomicrobiota bacterium]MBT6239904.1 hypothetical protein [Verrucomicrobiota bacterium]MBT7535327.1 hypothetical protein [Verrucomicrobiota bacterium]